MPATFSEIILISNTSQSAITEVENIQFILTTSRAVLYSPTIIGEENMILQGLIELIRRLLLDARDKQIDQGHGSVVLRSSD
jgi:hypothetical protein